MSEPAPPLTIAKINVAIMINDVKDALTRLTEQGKPNVFQAGALLGLSAAGHVLDGMTADEAWESIKPSWNRVLNDATTGGGHE